MQIWKEKEWGESPWERASMKEGECRLGPEKRANMRIWKGEYANMKREGVRRKSLRKGKYEKMRNEEKVTEKVRVWKKEAWGESPWERASMKKWGMRKKSLRKGEHERRRTEATVTEKLRVWQEKEGGKSPQKHERSNMYKLTSGTNVWKEQGEGTMHPPPLPALL